ncbi:MAG: DUF6147 family protein [Bacillota bacterium]
MKRRLIGFVLTLVMILVACAPAATAAIVTPMMISGGDCSLNNSGRNVTYAGYTSSPMTEDIISVTLTLMELRSGTWYAVNSTTKTLTNASYVSTSKSYTVTGGGYYKVKGYHCSNTDGQITSVNSESAAVWIP